MDFGAFYLSVNPGRPKREGVLKGGNDIRAKVSNNNNNYSPQQVIEKILIMKKLVKY